MSDDWKIYRLGQITDWFSGGTPRKNIDRYWNGDIPWISASSMSNNRISTSDMKITNEGLKSGSKLANKDDILLLVRGSILHQKIPVGIVMNEVSYNQDVKRIKVKDNLNPWFLLYWFIGNEKTLLRKVDVTGIGAGKFDTDFLQNYPISLPSLKEQKIIVDIVKSLDDKIYLNNQINQTLESIAQAMFKSWFIDFEPVRAKIAAKQEGKNSELAAMCAISGTSEAEIEQMAEENLAELRATAALFPDELVESELGEVPKGWEVSTVGDQIQTVGGATPSTKNVEFWDNGTHHWTTPKDLSNLTDKILLNTDRKITNAGLKKISSGLLPKDTVLMSSRAPVGYLALAKIEVAINQGYIAILPNTKYSAEYLIQWCEANMAEIKGRASGTTFQEISKKNFREINFICPDEKIVASYTKTVRTLYDEIALKAKESQSLVDIRDTLLPKLLSGEIDVSDLGSETEYEYSTE
ncbi:restriction endonuclease subunit S [Acinetobacter sp. YH16053]|uniref:restriction endonuclease subunit S n=1 Tax=Acinetobacter sp. YH16053 TaxID=2601192 RepID=UPI0015D34FA9